MARQGEDVVIIKDSKPVAALTPIDASDLALTPKLTSTQARRLERWIESQPRKTFPSAAAAVAFLKREHNKRS